MTRFVIAASNVTAESLGEMERDDTPKRQPYAPRSTFRFELSRYAKTDVG